MSSLKRIVSGTISGLIRNFFNLIIIIISLPVYLSFWEVELYGIWVLIFSIVGLIKLPIFTFQEYLQNEFLKIGQSNRLEVSKLVFGSIFITLIILFFFLILSLIIFESLTILNVLNVDQKYFKVIKISIFFLLSSEIIAYIVGILSRALYPFNYYPKIHWLGLLIVIVVPILQLISLFYGFKLIEVSILTFISTNFLNFIFLIYLFNLIKKENIKYKGLFISKNINHFQKSFYLLFGNFVTLIKNEGSRLIMVPFVGAIQLAAYATMKTANNMIKQLFNSFLNSLLIEFSGYINKKNKESFIKSYTFINVMLGILIIPVAFFMQIVISDLFSIWTKNKIQFDNILFASMTISFLIMIYYQPAYLIIKSRNMFIEEMKISIISSVVFIFVFIFFIEKYSIRGAGYALILTEIVACFYFFYYSNKWLKQNFIRFNKKQQSYCFIDLLISSLLILIIANNPTDYMKLIFIFLLYKILYAFYLFKIILKKKIFNFLI